MFLNYITEGFFNVERHSEGSSTSERQGGNSVAHAGARTDGNGESAASTAGAFIRFPEDGTGVQRETPIILNIKNSESEEEESDSDIVSGLADTIAELLDIE